MINLTQISVLNGIRNRLPANPIGAIKLLDSLINYNSTRHSSRFSIVRLSNRSMLQVTGRDTFSFIQTLITNDLQTQKQSVASLLVNENGRILCDLIVHRVSGDPFDKELRLNGLTWRNFGKRFVDCKMSPGSAANYDTAHQSNEPETLRIQMPPEKLWIECDQELAQPLLKTIVGRKVRENVNVQLLPHLNVYAIYPIDRPDAEHTHESMIEVPSLVTERALFTSDPRLDLIGYRFVTESTEDELLIQFSAAMLNIKAERITNGTMKDYEMHRFQLGVAEGLHELGHAKMFFLETNADYLNQLSFEKGSFTGNRPSGRVYSRKKLRMRLLPFEVVAVNHECNDLPPMPAHSSFVYRGIPVGRVVKNGSDGNGIGVFNMQVLGPRMALIDASGRLEIEVLHQYSGRKVRVRVPQWWPQLSDRRLPLLPLSNRSFESRLDQALRLLQNSHSSIVGVTSST